MGRSRNRWIIELTVVVALVVIAAALAIPNFLNSIDRSMVRKIPSVGSKDEPGPRSGDGGSSSPPAPSPAPAEAAPLPPRVHRSGSSHAKPAPPTAPPLAPGIAFEIPFEDDHPSKGAYWNNWARTDGHEDVKLAGDRIHLRPQSAYTLLFDLSAHDYNRLFAGAATSTSAGSTFQDELSKIHSEALDARVVFFVEGRGLRLGSTQAASTTVSIDLKALRQPGTMLPGEPFHEFADRTKAARVAVDIETTEPGEAIVGFCVFHKTLKRPVEVVQSRIVVDYESQAIAALPRSYGGTPLLASLLALLSTSSGRTADAALYVFEMALGDGQVRSHAVLIDAQDHVFTWRLLETLGSFVSSQSGLPHSVEAARHTHDYGPLSRALEEGLFSSDPMDDPEAQAARSALAALAGAPERRLLLVKLVDVSGSTLFIPLGLLPHGTDGVLADAVDIVQPLPYEDWSYPRKCIRSAQVLVPAVLEGLTGDELTGYLVPDDPADPVPRVDGMDPLSHYLDGTDSQGAPPGPEYLLLLCHQGGGNVWFSDPMSFLRYTTVRHSFDHGSAAFFIACRAGSLHDPEQRKFLTQLNHQGIDAAIISPFDVPPRVGARFAVHLVHRINEARRQHRSVTMQQLFAETRQAMLVDAMLGDDARAINEFILAGDGQIEICLP
jgi:hypothetical protein